MSLQGSASGNGTVAAASTASLRLRLNPNKEHKPDGYEDMQLDFSPNIFSSLERYLPPSMLNVTRDEKAKFMREILLKYLPLGERNRAQKHREYRERIIANYQPLHLELYSVDPATFFVPTFLRAINDNTEQSYRSIVSEPFPGIFIFDIFQTHFCELLLSEIENFEKWVTETKFRIMHPNTMNKFGAVLDDFGLETMLDKLMEGFIRPLSREVGGSTLDSHHGFVVEYGKDRDVDLGFHVDDSEVTLNVCLGKQFSGGELFFRGVRCEKHVNTGSHSEEIFDYSHVPGRAVLHRGRHRHGARATTSGNRVNLLLWCRSSVNHDQTRNIASSFILLPLNDDIVLLGESREELNERLETWRRALETHGFRLSRSKSEYMECKFNKSRRVSNSEVKIGDHIIPQVTRFKYLGSVIQDDGEIEGDVNHRIQAGWMKWRKASGVLCDAKVPIKLKGKFYRTAVRPAILYGTECWAVKSQHETKVGVAEMRMLRWMCGKTRQDKIRNRAIRERVGVAPIVEKMVENRLRWFGHVERRPVDSVVRRVDQMERRQTIRGRGRPKKTIREVIKKDLKLNDLDRSMVLDRTLWRKLIHVADPT
ncbi:putative PKHD-type hydroxylase [Glycine max]|nr:putative PKHD-type hydroxylase [Glycine max]